MSILFRACIFREPKPSTFLTASALNVIYKLYSVTHGKVRKRQIGDQQLPFKVDARIIQRCLHWLFIQQVRINVP